MNIFKYKKRNNCEGMSLRLKKLIGWSIFFLSTFYISWEGPSVLTIVSVQYLEFPTNKLESRLRVNFKRVGNFVPECPRVVSTQVKFDVISCNINVALGATTKLKQFARRFTKMCTLISLDSTKNFRFLASFIFSLSFHISRGQNRKSRFWPRRLQTRGDGWNSMYK